MAEASELFFWHYLDVLVSGHEVVIDRPKGSTHPRYPEVVYPLDYGYLQGTTTTDQGGIDVWVGKISGSMRNRHDQNTISAVILTVDLLKNDAEIKIALDCDDEDIQAILSFHNSNKMGATAIRRSET